MYRVVGENKTFSEPISLQIYPRRRLISQGFNKGIEDYICGYWSLTSSLSFLLSAKRNRVLRWLGSRYSEIQSRGVIPCAEG